MNSALDPQPRSFVGGFERDQPTVSGANKAVWVIRPIDGTRSGFQLAIEEFVKRFYVTMSQVSSSSGYVPFDE